MAEEEAVPLADRHPPFPLVVRQFHLNLDALRELVNVLVPQMRELDEERLSPDALAAVRGLSPEKREELRTAMREAFEENRTSPGTSEENGSDPSNGSTGAAGGGVDLSHIFKDDPHSLVSFLDGFNDAIAGPQRVTIVHNSLLATAISAFEALMAGIVTQYFILHPGARDSAEREFSYSDLAGFDSLDDAADLLISREVTQLTRGDLTEWGAWFKSRAKADFSELSLDYEALIEVFQRRHIITHNDARISRQYLSKIKQIPEGVKLGDRLTVDAEYLNRTLDQLDVLGTLTALMAWGTWVKDERPTTSSQVLRRSYQLLLLERWEAVSKISTVGERLKHNEAVYHSVRCNGWLARKTLHGKDEIENEVRDWDTSALRGRFELVQLVLLDELDEAVELVPKLIDTRELSLGELREWPILDSLREHDQYPDALKRAEEALDSEDGPEAL